MNEASKNMDFESAAIYRDRLAALSHIQSHQGINPRTVKEADVFSIDQQGGMSCVQVFFFRTGQNWGNRSYFPRADKTLDAAAVLKSFLTQFYDNKPCPRLILLSQKIDEMDLIGEALSARAGHKIKLVCPSRGERRELVEHAMTQCQRGARAKIGANFNPEHIAQRSSGGVQTRRRTAAY